MKKTRPFLPSNERAPVDSVERRIEFFWSIGAICLGLFSSIYRDRFIGNNVHWFLWMYKRTGLSLFKMQAEGMNRAHMYPFARAMGVLFLVIGSVLILRDFGLLPH